MDPLTTSPLTILGLDARSSLRFVTDLVHEDDVLCLALACRALRDALWARFPRQTPPRGDVHLTGKRIYTRDHALVATVARMVWTLEWAPIAHLLALPVTLQRMRCVAEDFEVDTASGFFSVEGARSVGDAPRNTFKAQRVDCHYVCRLAARHGALATLQWARAEGIPLVEDAYVGGLKPNAYEMAAEGGHLAVLQWLWTVHTTDSLGRQEVLRRTSLAMCGAAAGGHREALQWLRANISDAEWAELPFKGQLCPAAAKTGRLAALQWLRANGCQEWGCNTTEVAAGAGHLALLQWARANGCPWSGVVGGWETGPDEDCHAAIRGGHLAVLQWLRANGRGWGPIDVCTIAAGCGHLAVLQYVHANGCRFGWDTCLEAAYGGHPAVLQWLRANGCPWDADTALAAAQQGHLEVLKWVVANGCPWDRADCLDAAGGPPRHGPLALWPVEAEVRLGLGHIVALYDRSSTLYQIR
jgi:hypothetical protein